MNFLQNITWLPQTTHQNRQVNISASILPLYGIVVFLMILVFSIPFVQILTGLNSMHIGLVGALHFITSMMPMMIMQNKIDLRKFLLWEIYIDRMLTAAIPILSGQNGRYLWIIFAFLCMIEGLECGPSVYTGIAIFFAPILAYLILTKLNLASQSTQEFYTILIVTTLTFIFWFFISHLTKEFRQVQRETEKAIANKEIEKLVAEERSRMNAELHDLIGSDLTLLRFSLETRENSENGRSLSMHVNNIMMRLSELVKLNSIDSNLPEKLPELISDYVMEFAFAAGLKLNTDIGSIHLSPAQAFHAQRFIAEAFSNAARHAAAKTISVRLRSRKRYSIIALNDDGKGFQTKSQKPTGSGLVNMATRAKRSGGKFRYKSGKHGTTVALFIPR